MYNTIFSVLFVNGLSEDGELHIQLGKMRKGEVWKSVLKGHAALNPLAKVINK